MKPCLVPVAALAAIAFTASTAFAADADAGKKKVQGTCAVCHGLDGIAKNPEAPNLAGENPGYIIKQLKAFKSGDRKHEQMSIIAEGLSDDDMTNVAAWYSKIKITVEMPK
ncbi:MAG TPA: cytochrome c [Dongiaceae bacterium]|jgi:cytochrome c553|nr:cytochrome c [Dongiaceae bacterium]